MQRSYRTPKGTELPLLNLRGKEYLEVKYRLVWFREEHGDWSIETDLLNVSETNAFAKAVVKDASGRVIAVSHKFEDKRGFPDFIEKAETGAIGRALALVGYGTQFCADELDDPGVSERAAVARVDLIPASLIVENSMAAPGDYRVPFGKKYKGAKLSDIPSDELEGYVSWLENNAEKKGMPLSDEARSFKAAAELYLANI